MLEPSCTARPFATARPDRAAQECSRIEGGECEGLKPEEPHVFNEINNKFEREGPG
jgi:hypothetical protein